MSWKYGGADWLAKQFGGGGSKGDPSDPAFAAAGEQARGYGTNATNVYLGRAKQFDAMGTLRTAAGGLFDQFERDQGKALTELGGREVGAGRFGSGYAIEDSKNEMYDSRRQLNNQIAGLALNAEGLQQQNDQGIGQFGQNQTNSYLDILAGQRDTRIGQQNASQQRWADLLKALGQMGGTALTAAG